MIFAIISFLAVLSISLVVTRLAAMALTLTGMSRESARFQARSALTGVGFTTSESEIIVNHPVRRQIIMVLMLIGNIGIPTMIATLAVSLITTAQAEHWWNPVLLMIVGLGALIYAARSLWIEKHLNKVLAKVLKRWTDLEVRDYISLLQLQNGYAVNEMVIRQGDWLDGKSLEEAALPHEGILVLGIQRGSGEYIGAPRATDVIRYGDILVAYGWVDRLKELDQRTGPAGDAAHKKAVEEVAMQAE
jgi:TrkA-C domain